MADPDNVQILADQFRSKENGAENACSDAPETEHPDGGTFKSKCNDCLAGDDKELCVARLITSFMEQNNSN